MSSSLAGSFYKRHAVIPLQGLRLLVSTRFQVLFHSAPAVLFTFPSRYYPLSVAKEYLALGGGPPGFPRDSSCPAVLGVCFTLPCAFRIPGSHRLWPAFPCRSPKHKFALATCSSPKQPRYPVYASTAVCTTYTVWAPPLSLATTYGIAFAFSSSRYLDVSVPSVASACLCVQHTVLALPASGFPHSDIHGSMLAYSSPWHFGVRPVLLRLLAPRHPPCALPNFTTLPVPILRLPGCKVISYAVAKVLEFANSSFEPFAPSKLNTHATPLRISP